MQDRLLGYKTQPWCGKKCCHDASKKGKRILKKQLKAKEKRVWRKEMQAV